MRSILSSHFPLNRNSFQIFYIYRWRWAKSKSSSCKIPRGNLSVVAENIVIYQISFGISSWHFIVLQILMVPKLPSRLQAFTISRIMIRNAIRSFSLRQLSKHKQLKPLQQPLLPTPRSPQMHRIIERYLSILLSLNVEFLGHDTKPQFLNWGSGTK